MMSEAFKPRKCLSGNVKVTVRTSGAVEVDRESLYASKPYPAQIRALERILAKGVGRAPNPPKDSQNDKG